MQRTVCYELLVYVTAPRPFESCLLVGLIFYSKMGLRCIVVWINLTKPASQLGKNGFKFFYISSESLENSVNNRFLDFFYLHFNWYSFILNWKFLKLHLARIGIIGSYRNFRIVWYRFFAIRYDLIFILPLQIRYDPVLILTPP